MSNDGKSDLFVFLGAAFATLIGLAVLQKWYGSYIDIRFNQQLAEAGVSEALTTARQEDEAAAQKRKLPLEQAISRLAQQGRGGFASIAPAPSQDLSAVAGWIYRPGFKPVTAHAVRVPKPAPAPTVEAAQPAEPAAAEPAAPSAPAPKPASQGVKAPAAPAKPAR